jgi:hypothetical protein
MYATGYQDTPFTPFYEHAQRSGWKILKMACGHDVMLDMPEELTAALIAAATAAAGAGS